MDPFVIVVFGSQKFTSAVCGGGGKFPAWKDSFTMKKTGEDLIKFEVWEYDSISNNDLIGEGVLTIS